MASRYLRVIRVLASMATVPALLLATTLAAHAETASQISVVFVQEDRFDTVDYKSRNNVNGNVDWPVTLMFYNNAEVNRVKNIFFGDAPGDLHSAFLSDVSHTTPGWDDDRGTKSSLDCFSTTEFLHMRVYADSDDRMYNVDWGYYVIGTTHYDVRECSFTDRQFGWSEVAQQDFEQRAQSQNYTVFLEWSDFGNAEPDRWEGSHFWQSSGRASAVYVP